MKKLPSDFSDLELLSDYWSHQEFQDRYRARIEAPFVDVKAFYDQMLPRMDAIMTFVDDFQVDDMPTEVCNLANLALAFMDVSPAVELFKSSAVPYGFDWQRMSYRDFSQKFETQEKAA